MSEDVKPVFEVLGIKVIVIAAGFCGGVISLAFISDLPKSVRYTAILAGLSSAIVFTPVAIYFWKFLADFEPAVAFILGIGGMSIVGKIHALIKNVDLLQLIKGRDTNKKK